MRETFLCISIKIESDMWFRFIFTSKLSNKMLFFLTKHLADICWKINSNTYFVLYIHNCFKFLISIPPTKIVDKIIKEC